MPSTPVPVASLSSWTYAEYSAMENERGRSSKSRTRMHPPECGVYSHLCGSEGDEAGPPTPARNGGGTSVGPVDVEPQAELLGQVRDLLEWVDGARGHGPHRADHGDRAQARGQILLDGPAQLVHAQAIALVHWERAHRVAAQTHHVGGPVVHAVRLRGRVDPERRAP